MQVWKIVIVVIPWRYTSVKSNTVKPLSKDEETELFRELSGPGDWDEARKKAGRRILESHLAQVVSIAEQTFRIVRSYAGFNSRRQHRPVEGCQELC